MCLLSSLSSVENRIHLKYTQRNRRKWNDGELLRQHKSFKVISCDRETDIRRYWNSMGVKNCMYNFNWFYFYNAFCDTPESLKLYIPNDFFHCYIDTFFSNYRKVNYIDNKNLYNLFFHDIPQPHTLVRKMCGLFLDENYEIIDVQSALSKCFEAKDVIIKPSINKSGGKGIVFWDSSRDLTILKNVFESENDFIVQSIMHQHQTLSNIHNNSLNTIRVMSLIYEGEVYILSSILRMGSGNSRVDNATQGGLFCGINGDGSLKKIAFDYNNNSYTHHPNGVKFEAVKIPNYDKCIECVKRMAARVYAFSRLVSWDLMVGLNGEIILIEPNLSYGGVGFHQMCNGPILKNMTSTIVKQVMSNSPFWMK